MWIAIQMLSAKADLFQELNDLFGQIRPRRLLVHAQRPTDDVLDELAGVQRRKRFLEDHLAIAAVASPRVTLHHIDAMCFLERCQVGLVALGAESGRQGQQLIELPALLGWETEVHTAECGIGEATHAPSQSGLATAALTNEAHRLAPAQVEADTIDCLDLADNLLQCSFLDGEMLLEIAHGEKDVVILHERRRSEADGAGHCSGLSNEGFCSTPGAG